MSNDDRLDIIIFGATGFTGKRTIPQLSKLIKYENLSLTWGVAGRSEGKLKEALSEMQAKTNDDYSRIHTIYADVDDNTSLEKMTSSARIIINVVGPYRFFGERVVEACLKSGTHHVDVTGEAQFMELIQLKYHEAAKEKGIYLISACGLESIPADLGVIFLQKNFEGTLNSVDTYLYVMEEDGPYDGASVHYTTYESAVWYWADRHQLKEIRSKLHPEKLPEFQPKRTLYRLVFKNKLLNRWCTLFPGPDASVAYRTQRYMFETCKRRPVQVHCYVGYDSFFHFIGVLFLSSIFWLMTQLSFTRKLLLKFPKLFTWGFVSHDGPSEERQENSFFHMILAGEGWTETLLEPTDQFTTPPEKIAVAKVSGRNPGYGATCLALAASAITVLIESDKLPDRGGCYTPGAAFANTTLIERLDKFGVTFEMNPQL